MGVTRPTYATRESIKAALDVKWTARMDAQVDDALQSAADTVDGELLRRFYPVVETRSFDWPNHQYAPSWRLWIETDDLISVTTLIAGGVTISASDLHLRRSDDRPEPPYDHIEIDLSSSAAFSTGDTHQQSVVVAGVWGCRNDESAAGTLAAAIGTTTTTTADVSNSAAVGVGDLVRVDSERLLVVDKAMLDTGQNLATGLTTAATSDVAGTVADNTVLHVGETLMIDSERVLLVDKSGSTGITVKRAWDGTVLATHTTPDIYAPRRLTVTRGAYGTTAATHLIAAPVLRWDAPAQIRALARAEAINTLQQELAAYGRTVGSGENEREAAGKGLADARARAMTAWGRKARLGAI